MTATLTRRERQRAATVEEIREVARGLMRAQGTTDVRFTDIAKEMGMTPPALYRYYADRDALLTDLITEAYNELGREVAEARENRDQDDIGGRWIAAGTAYRDWARREPQQFALILGMPVPGYVAPQDRSTSPRRARRDGTPGTRAARDRAFRGPLSAVRTVFRRSHDPAARAFPVSAVGRSVEAWTIARAGGSD